MTHIEKHVRNIEDFYASNVLTLKGKCSDYAEETDAFSNFRFAAQVAKVSMDQVFLVLYGIKLARLRNLLLDAKEPFNESIVDTLGDDANYRAIHASYLEMKDSTDEDYAYADSTDLTEEEDGEGDEEEPTPKEVQWYRYNSEPEAEVETAGTKLKKFLGF